MGSALASPLVVVVCDPDDSDFEDCGAGADAMSDAGESEVRIYELTMAPADWTTLQENGQDEVPTWCYQRSKTPGPVPGSLRESLKRKFPICSQA